MCNLMFLRLEGGIHFFRVTIDVRNGNIPIFQTAETLRGPWHPEEVQQTRLYNEFTVDVGQVACRT